MSMYSSYFSYLWSSPPWPSRHTCATQCPCSHHHYCQADHNWRPFPTCHQCGGNCPPCHHCPPVIIVLIMHWPRLDTVAPACYEIQRKLTTKANSWLCSMKGTGKLTVMEMRGSWGFSDLHESQGTQIIEIINYTLYSNRKFELWL